MVLPAPLGPSNPKISPLRTVNETLIDRNEVPPLQILVGLRQMLDMNHEVEPSCVVAATRLRGYRPDSERATWFASVRL